jgi:hypothetical protein
MGMAMQSKNSDTTRELVEQSNQSLADFLKIDLSLGMEFAKLAQNEKQIGDMEGWERNKRNALRVLETVAHFESRIHPSSKQEIERLRAELRQFISTM